MARIAGVNIPREKHLGIALTYIYGIGNTTARGICKKLKINPGLRVSEVEDDILTKIRLLIESDYQLLEGDLRRKVASNIKRLTDVGCYRGIRHIKKLPVRGQRTHTNAKTRKGKGVAIANKKKAVK